MSGATPEGSKLHKFLFVVWLLDSAALVVIFLVILLQGQTPGRIDFGGRSRRDMGRHRCVSDVVKMESSVAK
jgi:hypothetical protein